MLKHAISISCCLNLAPLALFCITKPRKTLERDLTHVQNTGTAYFSYSLAIYGYIFQNVETITRRQSQNKTHADKLIGRFYYMLHGFSNKNLRIPTISITQIHFW